MSRKSVELLAPDPARDKDKFKRQIAAVLGRRNPDMDAAEVRMIVDTYYEDMLRHAEITMHVPSLIVNELNAMFRRRVRTARQV